MRVVDVILLQLVPVAAPHKCFPIATTGRWSSADIVLYFPETKNQDDMVKTYIYSI